MKQTITVERVDHIGIRVPELDRALDFYRALGFELLRRAEGDDVAIIRNKNGVELNLIFNADATVDRFRSSSAIPIATSSSCVAATKVLSRALLATCHRRQRADSKPDKGRLRGRSGH
jgi:hypothetical protein